MTNTPAPSRHERRRQQTRRQLIETTLKLILEKGYDAITIQDITDRADLGRGTFYIHFKDKADVVWEGIQDMLRGMEQEAHRQFDPGMSQVEYYALRNIFRHAQANRDLYRVVFGGQGSAMLAGRVQDLLAKILLFDIRRAPEPDRREFDIPPDMLAQMLTGLITRILFWWLESAKQYSAEEMAAFTYEVLYRRPPPAETERSG
ncbi:MAG: TetR/AcrR family transcriptional regulator [Anaerolineales bacterium]